MDDSICKSVNPMTDWQLCKVFICTFLGVFIGYMLGKYGN